MILNTAGEPYGVQPGICVIINNTEFISAQELSHGKKDEESLTVLFTSLKFDVKRHQNLTAQQMVKEIKYYSNVQHKGVFFLIILSYGTLVNYAILGTDGKPVTIHQLENLFCPKNCPSLCDVPKIFMIDAIQDSQEEKHFITKLTEGKKRLAYRTDMAQSTIIYASTYGRVALLSGSQFTETLVKVIAEATPNTSFTQIIQEVKARIQRSNTCQTVEVVDKLTCDYFIKRY